MDKTLLLVDGSSYLYRAFHAMPDLRNALGEPTGAIYGVINMLRRLRNDYKADYLACVFDAKGKTFRDDLYADYKANRAPMPDDLVAQIAPLHDAVRALGWPLLMIDGVEADDVIGTLAHMATREGVKTVVSTGDKDLTQLVNPGVTLVNTMSNEVLDEAGVTQKFGVPPALIVDYLSLIGDAVDNVPGVHKVGPKTAVKWLTQYGSLDAVMAHAGEIGGAVGENLRQALEWLPKGRHLLTVKCDVPLPAALHDLAAKEQDAKTLAALFERYGFKTWLKEVQGGAGPAVGAAAPGATTTGAPAGKVFVEDIPRHYDTLLNEVELLDWMEILARADIVSLDTETTGLDPLQAQLVGMSFSIEPGRAAYLPLAHSGPGVAEQLGDDGRRRRKRRGQERRAGDAVPPRG